MLVGFLCAKEIRDVLPGLAPSGLSSLIYEAVFFRDIPLVDSSAT